MKTNPLITRTSYIPFDQLSAEQIAEAVDLLLKKASEELAVIKSNRGPRTFENTMLALDNVGLELQHAMSIISHLESVATTPAWRAAYNEVLPRVTEFRSRLLLDEELWRALSEYEATPEAKSLPAHRRRYVTKTIDAFRRNGAELNKVQKDQLAALDTDLADRTNSFSQNTLDATNAFEFTTTDGAVLAGLPESALTLGKASAAAKGLDGWRFTLQAPSLIAILTYADNRSLRERFYRAHNTRCSTGNLSNRDNLYRILELRHKKAELLGFKDFSDLVLADRMAKTGGSAEAFVRELQHKVEPHFRNDSIQLHEFVQKRYGIDPQSLEPWDISYYVEKMRKELYDFDEEELRPYFPLPHVMQGLFTVVERTFGISVSKNSELSTWDPLVTAYSAHDKQTGELLGFFYADLFPRENKRGGAWMDSLVTHAASDGSKIPHVGLIAGNFTPPTTDAPSLLTHDEVTTLFHEFGHLLHLLCNKTELRDQSMSGVAWDFIELPSQIMENWGWEKDALTIFASHYQTSEPLPQHLFDKMLKAKNYRSASHMMRQIGFASVDLALHRHYNKERDGDVVTYAREIVQRFSPLPLPADYGMILTFTHLFSSSVGYAAGYYSYHWAEVLDADAFSRFKQQGVFDMTTGLDFRDIILSRGDSQDPEILFEQFMGRKADMQALLERAGLVG